MLHMDYKIWSIWLSVSLIFWTGLKKLLKHMVGHRQFWIFRLCLSMNPILKYLHNHFQYWWKRHWWLFDCQTRVWSLKFSDWDSDDKNGQILENVRLTLWAYRLLKIWSNSTSVSLQIPYPISPVALTFTISPWFVTECAYRSRNKLSSRSSRLRRFLAVSVTTLSPILHWPSFRVSAKLKIR